MSAVSFLAEHNQCPEQRVGLQPLDYSVRGTRHLTLANFTRHFTSSTGMEKNMETTRQDCNRLLRRPWKDQTTRRNVKSPAQLEGVADILDTHNPVQTSCSKTGSGAGQASTL
ncbi:uncharacterized protein UV8b_02174 [Ustilaginoidea virens]|uniref:Uncharacterized protein n=1 Tax=Ustilaginoidea virens TaxID=1159556 RepID=A0A8E5HMC3_USTVR|nr:uncharacterized protein UV8b_02174 [Ustilaginoidea virens]QUC17933.1 hypothetical protein UV8b_02174 [Ustilaginoidea virens]